MKRREFIKTGSLACGFMATSGMLMNKAFAGDFTESELFNIPRPKDIKLNVKPLFGIRVPIQLHEGPCRSEDPLTWDRQKELNNGKREYEEWKETLRKSMPSFVNLLDPVYVLYAGDHIIDLKTWNEITTQDEDTDVYLLSRYRIPGLGSHTDKPIVMVGNRCASMDVPALLKSQGKESYGALDYEDASSILDNIRVRKALMFTKILIVSDGEWDYEFNAVRSKIKTSVLQERFGIGSEIIPISEMMDNYARLEKDGKYDKEAQRIAKHLADNAGRNDMALDDVRKSVMYYLTAKNMMQKYGCNAFTATCQEFCVSRLAMKYRVTPCLTHALLKGEGYVSACEGDTNVAVAMAIEMYRFDKAPYMGNSFIHDVSKNLVGIHHDVPALKMHGYDKEDSPYHLIPFTERKWGATIRYDFSKDKGDDVTFCRLTPNGDKILIVKGKIDGVEGLDKYGCSLRAVIKVADARKYFKSAQQTGHHFAVVYGDYSEQLSNLADVMGLESEIV